MRFLPQVLTPHPCLALLLVGVSFLAAPASAQYSPRCRLNGFEVFCAMTTYGPADGSWWRTTVVLDDDRRIDLHVDRATCRKEQGDTICSARISMRDTRGSRTALGSYRSHRSEGGVSHHYQGGAVDLTYVFMD